MLGAVWLGVLTGIVRSGIKPGPSDPNKWYDRAIRIFGGLLIGLMALLGLIIHVIQIK
jgi:hypothetical protein